MPNLKSRQLSNVIYGLGGLNIAIILLFWWQGSGHEALRTLPGFITAIGRISGLLGAFFIILEFISMSRLPVLETALGRAQQVKLHKWFGYAGFLLILLHLTLLTVGYAIVDRLSLVGQFVNFFNNFPDVYQSVVAVLLLFVVVGLSIWVVRQHIRYEAWYFVHLLSYLVILLAFSHQMKNGADFIGHPLVQAYWWALYILTFLLVVGYRFVRPVAMALYYDLRVERIEPAAKDTFSIYIAGRNLASLKFSGGQFAIWWFLGRGLWWQGHPFSFSTAPGGKQLRLTFKISGDFTTKLPQIKPGTPVIMDGPYGVFTANAIVKPKLLMIAGGIGLTPLASMMTESAAKSRDIVLLYSARTEADLALKSELESYAHKLGIKITYIISDDPSYSGATGRLDQAKLQQLVPDVADREVFLCGPPPMMAAVSAALIQLGIAKNLINTENFSF